eukprot:2789958-Prymnesium_polylepis.1
MESFGPPTGSHAARVDAAAAPAAMSSERRRSSSIVERDHGRRSNNESGGASDAHGHYDAQEICAPAFHSHGRVLYPPRGRLPT